MKKNKKIFIILYVMLLILIIFLIVSLILRKNEKYINSECENFTDDSYKLILVTNSGVELEPINVCVNCLSDVYEKLPVLKKNNATFDGWYYDENLINKVEFENVNEISEIYRYDENNCKIAYEDITLYAKWIEEKINTENGNVVTNQSSESGIIGNPSFGIESSNGNGTSIGNEITNGGGLTNDSESTNTYEKYSTDLPITIQKIGSLPSGYIITNIEQSVETVGVSGKEISVKKLSTIEAYLDISNLTSSQKIQLSLITPVGVDDMTIYQVEVNVTVEEMINRTFANIQLSCKSGWSYVCYSDGDALNSVDVIVEGPKSVVENLTRNKIIAYCDMSGFGVGYNDGSVYVSADCNKNYVTFTPSFTTCRRLIQYK